VNAGELYLLGQALTRIAATAMPEDSPLRTLSPAARLVLADARSNPGAPADEIAARTGLEPGQVAAILQGPAAGPLTAGLRSFSGDVPVGEALAAALETSDSDVIRQVSGMLESLSRRLRVGSLLRTTGDFDAAYGGTPPWDTGRPQPAFAELAEAGALRGRVLDVGCGTGEHALLAAARGLDAWGVDTSPAAIALAGHKAAERGLSARFSVHDALDLPALGERFDTVLDSALFHVFSDEDRVRYAASLRGVVPPGGRYFMLCFSDRQPPGFGPRRVSRAEIEATFADGWRVDAIDAVTLEVTIDPSGVRAWRASLTRI
jgi:SAM-dependent methyltransferase